jgi:DNA-binding NarL/FixJ family response regulator
MKSENALKVLVFDAHPISQRGIRLTLDNMERRIKVTETGKTRQFYKNLEKQTFDLVIMSVNDPGDYDTTRLSAVFPKILVLYTEEGAETALDLLALGAGACMSKKSTDEELMHGISEVLQNRRYLCPTTQKHINTEYLRFRVLKNGNEGHRPRVRQLTSRESEVASLMATGLGNGQIAHRLQIQTSTVSSIKSRVFRKLSVTNLVQAIQMLG